jgi:hypothetical protein
MMPNQPDDTTETPRSQPLSSPYGPHPGHVDDASGGADSSPFETLSSDERAERLAKDRTEPPEEDPEST